MAEQRWVALEQPVLDLHMRGRSPMLHLNADARRVLQRWHGNAGELRITVVQSEARPALIAVGLDPYGVLLNEQGRASAARFTKHLGVTLPVSVTLSADDSIHLLTGSLTTTQEQPVPLKLPPLSDAPKGSIRHLIRQVSTQELPADDAAHEDTLHEDDEEFGDDEDAED